jgi:hypothetical protein
MTSASRRASLLALAALAALAAPGCALLSSEGPGARTASSSEGSVEDPSATIGTATASTDHLPPRVAGSVLPPTERLEVQSPRTIPGGVSCLLVLERLGIPHQVLGATEGIETPVKVSGEIAGVSYRPLARIPLVADCRLVVALHRAGPYLRQLGIEEMQFSSAYRARSRMPSGKLSRHGIGLAIDVHAIRLREGGERLRVQDDFQRSLADGCTAPTLLNRLACVVLRQGLFDLALTPDYDAAHYNHFHLDIEPLSPRTDRRRGPSSRPAVLETEVD